MTKSETERTAGTGQTESKENPELVRMIVESSAECSVPFQKLPRVVRSKIIDGMTAALTEAELEFRGQWNRRRTDVNYWKTVTLYSLYAGFHHDFEPDHKTKATSTGAKLAQLAQKISAEEKIQHTILLNPIRRVFQRSADTLEAGFTEYSQTRKYRGRAIGTGFSYPGQTRSTNPQNPHCAGMGRGIL